MERLQLKESIRKATKRLNFKEILSNFFVIFGTVITTMLSVIGVTTVLDSANIIDLIGDRNVAQYFTFALVLMEASTLTSVTLVGVGRFLHSKISGTKNLRKIAKYLSTLSTNKVTTSSLKNAEVISECIDELTVTSEKTERVSTETNLVLIETPGSGKIVVAREFIKKVKNGNKMELVGDQSSLDLLSEAEANQVIDENPSLVQKVLSKRIKGR